MLLRSRGYNPIRFVAVIARLNAFFTIKRKIGLHRSNFIFNHAFEHQTTPCEFESVVLPRRSRGIENENSNRHIQYSDRDVYELSNGYSRADFIEFWIRWSRN